MTTWLNVTNNAQSALYAGITAAATSLTLLAGEGAKFPSASFNISIDDEILYCSSRTGDVLTVVRAQEGTAAAIHSIAATVSLNVTAGVISQLQAAIDAALAPAHAATHKWLGTDAINIKDSFLAGVYPLWIKNWADLTAWTGTYTGTGAFTAGFITGALATGATSGSTACIASNSFLYCYNAVPSVYLRFMQRIHTAIATGAADSEFWCGLLKYPTAPSATQLHIAFKVLNNKIYASWGDGTNGQLVELGTFSQFTMFDLYFKQIGTIIYFYINGILKHTSDGLNCPDATSLYPCDYIKNSAAVNKSMNLYPMHIIQGPD